MAFQTNPITVLTQGTNNQPQMIILLHSMQRPISREKILMLRKVEGKIRRRWPRARWKDSTPATINSIKIVKKKRKRWPYILTIKKWSSYGRMRVKSDPPNETDYTWDKPLQKQSLWSLFKFFCLLADTILCLAVGKEIQMKDHGSQSWWKY